MKRQTKKKDEFKDFYEDEESLKMMKAINKSANEEKKKREQQLFQEARTEKAFKIFVIALLIALLTIVLIINGKLQQSGIESCIKKGNTESYCIAHS